MVVPDTLLESGLARFTKAVASSAGRLGRFIGTCLPQFRQRVFGQRCGYQGLVKIATFNINKRFACLAAWLEAAAPDASGVRPR